MPQNSQRACMSARKRNTSNCAGISPQALTHEEVMEVARAVEGKFLALLRAFLPLAFAAMPARAARA